MIVKSKAIRSYRKQFMAKVRAGQAELRVVGDSKTGFNLAAVAGEKAVILYARPWVKQTEAQRHGQDKFGVVAGKMKLTA